MRRDASRTEHLSDIQPMQGEGGLVLPINPRQMQRAFAAWLKKRGFQENRTFMPRFGRPQKQTPR